MTAFRITFAGAKVVMRVDGEDTPCGLIKNEYVWAKTESEAIEKAKEHLLSRLVNNPAIHQLGDSPISLNVEEVETGIPLWKLLSNEGFVFYKLDPPG